MNYWLLLIPFLSAFIGWLSIRLSVYLLFHPLRPQKFAGIVFQGIIPARQESLAIALGKFVSQEFAFFDNLEQKISDPGNFENVKPLIEEHIDDFLRNKLKEQMPMISMFIGDKTIITLKTVFIQEIESLFPQVIGRFAGNLKKDFNIQEMVASKISSIPASSLEQLYIKSKNESRKAAFFAALLGLSIGLVQLTIILLTQ